MRIERLSKEWIGINNTVYLETTAISLALSTVVIYFLAKYEPKYFELIIAAISAIYVYAVTTLYALIKGVSAQQVSIPLSILSFAFGYFYAKRALISDKEREKNGTYENLHNPHRSPSALRERRDPLIYSDSEIKEQYQEILGRQMSGLHDVLIQECRQYFRQNPR